jgi:hypothetical protein
MFPGCFLQEFADVWNDPNKGLHLMVPVQKKSMEVTGDETVIDVKLKKSVNSGTALAAWQRSKFFPLWDDTDTQVRLSYCYHYYCHGYYYYTGIIIILVLLL